MYICMSTWYAGCVIWIVSGFRLVSRPNMLSVWLEVWRVCRLVWQLVGCINSDLIQKQKKDPYLYPPLQFQDVLEIYRLPPLLPTSKTRWFHVLMGFDWKWGVWCIPNSDFCVVQPCRGLLFGEKTWLLHDFLSEFQIAIKSMNHQWK